MNSEVNTHLLLVSTFLKDPLLACQKRRGATAALPEEKMDQRFLFWASDNGSLFGSAEPQRSWASANDCSLEPVL
ncbi:hypothetical protein MHYP_G00219550 [Metynnis hypsauchen]